MAWLPFQKPWNLFYLSKTKLFLGPQLTTNHHSSSSCFTQKYLVRDNIHVGLIPKNKLLTFCFNIFAANFKQHQTCKKNVLAKIGKKWPIIFLTQNTSSWGWRLVRWTAFLFQVACKNVCLGKIYKFYKKIFGQNLRTPNPVVDVEFHPKLHFHTHQPNEPSCNNAYKAIPFCHIPLHYFWKKFHMLIR